MPINKWWFISVFLLFFPPFNSLHPLSLSAHLNNYYNPEECKLRGTNNGGKGKTLKNSFAFSSPRHPNIYSLIPSIISWFKQQTIITLPLHCSNAMNTFELIKMLQVSKPTRRFSSYFPEFPKKSEYNDCCGELEWGSRWLWRHKVIVTSSVMITNQRTGSH